MNGIPTLLYLSQNIIIIVQKGLFFLLSTFKSMHPVKSKFKVKTYNVL